MEIFFRNSDMDNYMDVQLNDISTPYASPAGYKIHMIEENNIPYMLRPTAHEIDGEVWLRYSTGASYILERMLCRVSFDGTMLRLIMAQLCECIFSLEKYLLSANDLVVDARYMLYKPDTESIGIIYAPEYNMDIRQQIKALLEALMKQFDHRDREGLVYMYGLYDLLTDVHLSMTVFKNAVFNGIDENEEYETADCDAVNMRLQKPQDSDGSISASCLVPLTNGALDTMNFSDFEDTIIIGRGKRKADYRLSTYQISRVHAHIYKQGNQIFIEDRNSTNGTFLNSVRLAAHDPKPIKQGDIISFANEEFFVK